MKYLVVFAVVMVAYWFWRNGRQQEPADEPPPRRAPHAPAGQQPMVRCAQCALHLPESDAVKGRKGWYCGTAHRDLLEG